MKRALFLAVITLSGCATAPAWIPQARQLISTGRCNDARTMVYANEKSPGRQAALIGGVFADCDRDMPNAYRNWTLAARYGHQGSRQVLAEQGPASSVA